MKTGQILHDRYQIDTQLDRDGICYLYRAIDIQNQNQPVLLKIFAPGKNLTNPELQRARELLVREAKILNTLSHHTLPTYLDHFPLTINNKTTTCVISSWIEGIPYRKLLLQGNRFNANDVIWILAQSLEVLDHLHTHRPPIIHRNLTLDTLIKTPKGIPTLTDFSLSRSIQEFQDETVTQVATPGFSPPEQQQGKISPATDLYALGVIGICLLTGEVKPQNLKQNGQWNWKSYVHENLDPRFIQILDTLITPTPTDRPPSARLALRTLKPLLENMETRWNGTPEPLPPEVIPPESTNSVPKWFPWAIGISGSLIFLALIAQGIRSIFQEFNLSPTTELTSPPVVKSTQRTTPIKTLEPTIPQSPGICREQVLDRGTSIGITNWDIVDQKFAEQYPDLDATLIDPTNPKHHPYIQSWCDIANQWMDQRPKL